MRFSKALISFGVTSVLAVGANLFSLRQAEAQSSPSPFVVFVDGSGDCCAYAMTDLQTRLRKDLNATIWKTSYANFRDGSSTQKTPGVNLSINSDVAFIAEGAIYINTKLAKNTPLVLIGHSYGGDSVLKLLSLINRPVQFVAVIDPVSTAGFRSTLSRYTVPGTVGYFFNRWQKNEPFPIDFKNDGSIKCNAQKCDDQSEQWNHVDANGNPHRKKCGLLETCRTKQVKSGHQTLPTDDWIEKTLGDRISEQLAAFKPTPASSPTSDSLRSLQSVNFPGHFIRHANFFGYISTVDSDLSRKDATWSMVPGLANSQCVSFESKNFPGHYLRHQGLRIKLHQNDNTSLFKADATFCQRSGLADSSSFSFESLNFPNHYIRHRASELWVDPQANNDLYRKDATFRIVSPFIR